VSWKNRQRGKRAEKAIAERLGGKRVGVLGDEDVQHPLFSIEVKSRQRFAGEAFMQQAIRNCQGGKIPIVVVHISGRYHGNNLVMMRLKDFEDCLGRITKQNFD
jgi:hypothetical protein